MSRSNGMPSGSAAAIRLSGDPQPAIMHPAKAIIHSLLISKASSPSAMRSATTIAVSHYRKTPRDSSDPFHLRDRASHRRERRESTAQLYLQNIAGQLTCPPAHLRSMGRSIRSGENPRPLVNDVRGNPRRVTDPAGNTIYHRYGLAADKLFNDKRHPGGHRRRRVASQG